MENYRKLIENRFLPAVTNPMRYSGSELNCVKKELSSIKLHGVLCFPDLYDIGMSHFGLQILYTIVNKNPEWALSRCFHPWADAESLLRLQKIPLYTLEYFTPIRDADWIGFSLQYELQYTNVVNMLDLAGIPLRSKNRDEKDPIVLAGGPCVNNPEPLADFIDCFAIGDGEESITLICEMLEKAKKDGLSRYEKLVALSRIPGMYVPSLYSVKKNSSFVITQNQDHKPRAAKIPVLRDEYYPQKPIVPLIEVIHSRLAVEVMRGCTRGCRFCSAGYFYRPLRERTVHQIYNQIRDGVTSTGFRDIGLLSLSTADYSCISALMETVHDLKEQFHLSLALPSTRVDALSDEQMGLFEKVTSTSSLTIAPEAASMRLRKVINKNFTDAVIYATVDRLLDKNVQTIKLYFMIGLPTENRDDIDAIVTMVSRISGMVRAKSKRRMVHVAISPFSPKPHTPFAREKMETVETLIERSIFIKRSLRHLKNVKVSYRNPEITLLETVMARGDRKIGDLIYLAWSNGSRFDGWDECFSMERWFNAAEELQIDLNSYLGEISNTEEVPWNSISTGINESFLFEEKSKAYNELSTDDCRTESCSGCGMCHEKVKNLLQNNNNNPSDLPAKNPKINQDNTGKNHSYRFTYKKGDNLRYLGHLDMVSLFHRAFAIAGIPLAYSKGFNPHPRVSFGPPLPLGASGDNEYFDIETTGALDSDPFIINTWLPDQIKVFECIPIQEKTPSINSSVIASHYYFEPLFELKQDVLNEKLYSCLSQTSITIEIKKDDTTKNKDIRSGILELYAECDGKGFDAVLAMGSGKTCKPLELISVLFPEKAISDFNVIRRNCII